MRLGFDRPLLTNLSLDTLYSLLSIFPNMIAYVRQINDFCYGAYCLFAICCECIYCFSLIGWLARDIEFMLCTYYFSLVFQAHPTSLKPLLIITLVIYRNPVGFVSITYNRMKC